MAQMFYMRINGKKVGRISDGVCKQPNRADTIPCVALEQEITKAHGPTNYEVTGTAVHRPLKITKEFDKSSPQLYQALYDGDTLEVKLEFYKNDGAGNQSIYFTIEMFEAVIVGIKPVVPRVDDPQSANSEDLEEISFVYKKITYTNTREGTAYTYDWRNPATS